MSKSKGTFIKLDRGIQENWLWEAKPFSPGQAWIDLLMMAAHSTGPRSWKGSYLTQHRGEVFTSIVALADRWGWNEKKVARFIKALESDQMVRKGVLPKGTLLTIENYEKFQGRVRADDRADDRASSEQSTEQVPTIKECKERKECEEYSKSIGGAPSKVMTPPTVAEVRAYCIERGNAVDPEKFVDYYTSNGWMVGKGRMKDWKAAVRTWEKRERKPTQQRPRNEILAMMQEEGMLSE